MLRTIVLVSFTSTEENTYKMVLVRNQWCLRKMNFFMKLDIDFSFEEVEILLDLNDLATEI